MADNENFQKYYNVLARINFNSRQFIEKGADEKQKLQRLQQMITLLEKCAKTIEAPMLVKPDCPRGTTWDPITKTCC
jgi:hypothetical protein